MNKQDLVNAALEYLRPVVVGTLNISAEHYRASLDAQHAANRCLTNVMALGYNDELSEALQEILEHRYFNGFPTSAEFDKLTEELRACRETFHAEIAAYRFLHENFDQGMPPEEILIRIKSMAPTKPEYKNVTTKDVNSSAENSPHPTYKHMNDKAPSVINLLHESS